MLGLLMTTVVCQAQITSPGWFRVQKQTLSVAARPSFAAQSQFKANGLLAPLVQGVPGAPVAEAVTPEIQALADGLQDDPYRIFNYVHDHIKFVLYFGSKKGAELTLLEKSGNDFDQSALLVALLRAAGYTNVQYQFGWQEMPYDDPNGFDYDLHHWWQLTLNNTNWMNTVYYVFDLVSERGYPAFYYFLDGNTFDIQRTWVALTIGSTTYQLDPAFKISKPVSALSGFSLTNALGGTGTTISNALLSAAAGTNTVNYAQNLNEAAVRSKLTAYTTNLLNYIQSNSPNASVQDILGGWQIVPAYDPWDFTPNTRFYVDTFFGQMPVLSWANEPTNIMSTLQITFAGTNYQWFMPQLQGQRLALTFDNSGTAQLWQDDTLLAQHTTSGSSSTTNVILFVHHPFGIWDQTNNVFIDGTRADGTVTNSYQRTNSTYALLYAFEPEDWGWLQQRESKLDGYLQAGLTNGSRQVASETLNVMGLNWMLQTAQTDQMLAAQLGILPQFYHRLGRMAQETGNGYYVDVYMQITGEYPSGGDDAAHIQILNIQFDLLSFFFSSLEHGIIEQLQSSNLVAASTVKMLEIANTNGQAVYLAGSNNWSAVQGSLVNYSSSALATIGGLINSNYYVLLPKNGSNHIASATGSWAGYGYEARQVVNGQPTDSRMIISGGYNGGFSEFINGLPDVPAVQGTGDAQPNATTITPLATSSGVGADPVDMADGTFQVEHTDLSLGQAEPRGLTLSRYYNGTRRYNNPAGMAGGWIHNYCVTANNVVAPQASLGGTTPTQAASMLAATAAAIAMYNGGYPDPKNWLTTALIAKWGVDQITKGGVSVVMGKDTVQFVKQPNGVFTPPANCTASLAQNGSAYSLTLRHGNKFNFNAGGLLTNIVDQYGQSLNLTYNASNWVATVKDWQNRHTVTFNYSGTPWRLASVSDGARTVNYSYSTAYNPQGDLASFTDPEGKASTYVYDTNHQITATIDANSRLVVSNLYDSLGHVAFQYTQGDTNKTWRIFWSGWQTIEQDPAGSQRNFSYDDEGRLISLQDQLGNLTQAFYDGQNHVVMTVSPLNETNRFIYDGNHNLTNSIDALGFTNQFFYDGQNNLVRAVDARGNPRTFGYNTSFSLTGATNGAGDWVNFTYNTDGTLKTRSDAGGTTHFDGYDNYGQLNHVAYPDNSTESFVNSSFGDVTNHTDGRGFATAFQYNNRRELTNSIAPTNLMTSVAFDAVGNVASTTDARRNTSTNIWSATRHLLATAFPATPLGVPVITNIYDNRDWLAKSLDPYQQPTVYTNNQAGRLLAATDPLQRTTRFTYDADGRKLATANAANETNSQTWDARGSLITLTDGAGHFSTRNYDAAGNQIILTNRNGKKWQFQFDAANRLTNTIPPSPLQPFSQMFNHQGLLAWTKSPAGHTNSFLYNGRGWLTNRADSVATTLYGYDANGNLTNVVEQASSLSQTFDAYNQMSSFKDAYGNLIQYRYDANGNLTNLVYPGNKNVFYAYDSNNHMTNVTDWAQRKTSIAYDLAGRLTTITRPNGTYRTIGYDAAGQVTNIWEQMANGLPIAWFRHNWNANATMQWEFAAPLPHAATVPTRNMTYDDDNRLATFQGPTMGSAQNVTVDNDGNLTYGPLTNDTFVTYRYDARNRLLDAGGVTNAYDAMNNRVGQIYGTNVTAYVSNPNASLPQVLMRIKNGVTNYYIYGAGLLYQVTETATKTNTLTYHYDYRGSTIALTDGNGLVTDRIEYSAYGLTTYRAGTNDTPFLFNGRYGVMTDPNGLLYMRARYYNPYLCRFLNPDPTGFSGGMNFYAYANGNPVSYIDPFGLGAVGENGNSGLGNWFRNNIPLIGGILGGVGDVLSGAGNMGLGIATFGQSGTFGNGVQEIAGGAFGEADIVGRDVAATIMGQIGKVYVMGMDIAHVVSFGNVQMPGGNKLSTFITDFLIPDYGNFGGSSWGLTQHGDNSTAWVINQIDANSLVHDQKYNNPKGNNASTLWDVHNWTPVGRSQSGAQAPGPAGIAYALIGTIPFWLIDNVP